MDKQLQPWQEKLWQMLEDAEKKGGKIEICLTPRHRKDSYLQWLNNTPPPETPLRGRTGHLIVIDDVMSEDDK